MENEKPDQQADPYKPPMGAVVSPRKERRSRMEVLIGITITLPGPIAFGLALLFGEKLSNAPHLPGLEYIIYSIVFWVVWGLICFALSVVAFVWQRPYMGASILASLFGCPMLMFGTCTMMFATLASWFNFMPAAWFS